MTPRVAIRLTDGDLSFVDRLVAEHHAGSRADAVRQAVRLLRKHEEDRREIDLLRAVKGPSIPDLDGLAEAITDAYDREGVGCASEGVAPTLR